MLALKLAWRNLFGAGLRTWLNVFILSLSFIVIIMHKGFLDGWQQQARKDMIEWQISDGQYWQKNYDPYDPFRLNEAHSPVPKEFHDAIVKGNAVPVLITQAVIYPEGRMRSILLKGIEHGQKILKLPSEKLKPETAEIPAIIGTRMAATLNLQEGSQVMIRWRDADGTFDAAEIKITGIFKTNVPAVDNGQIWISLERLQQMMQLPGQASIIIVSPGLDVNLNHPEWTFKSTRFLLSEIDDIIRQKAIGGFVLYIILIFLALLAIFDTQVLSVFRRQKEIGTHMALGMTRWQVIRLFTIEGAMHSVLALATGALYGIPLLSFLSAQGIAMPKGSDDYGFAIAEKIFPAFGAGLVLSTALIIFFSAVIVSYLPAKKISKMNPADAVRGRAR